MTLSEEGRNRVLSLWQEYCAALLRYAKKELGHPAPYGEAEDIVSDAFERLMIHYERYENLTDEQIKSLLIRTVRNLSVDAYRRRKRLPVPLSDPDGEDREDADPPLRDPDAAGDDLGPSWRARRRKSCGAGPGDDPGFSGRYGRVRPCS